MTIEIGNEALALVRRLNQDPENTDALQVLDTQSNLGAVSQKNAQDAGLTAVKQKPPKYEFETTPDGGTVMHAKNVPVVSPADQVKQAGAKPFLTYADALKAQREQTARVYGELPDPENLPNDPEQLAHELGIEPPHFSGRDGIIGLIQRNRQYSRLLDDPQKLRMAVAVQRLKQRQAALDEGAKAANEEKQLEYMNLATEREKRLQAGAQQKGAKSIDDLLTSDKFHINRVAKSPDEAVQYMKGLAEAHGEEWNDALYAPLVKMKFADGMRDDAEQELSDKKKQLDLEHEQASTKALIAAMSQKSTQQNQQEDFAKNIAGDVMSGLQPPDLKGLYRYGAAVRSELAKNHFDLTTATREWNATQKFVASANGQQQLRLRQAIDFVSHSLDNIDELAQQWDAGGFPALNKARLAAAKSGALGPQAQSIATRLDSAINDGAAEMGNVIMGGNSPTDHALTLASANLKSEWSRKTLQDNVDQVRKLLGYRKNAIESAGPVGVAPNSPYNPSQTSAPSGGIDVDRVMKRIEENRKKKGRP